MANVFVSHSRRDADTAEQVHGWLRAEASVTHPYFLNQSYAAPQCT